jgi:uncharacterized protein (DUF2132 family)
MSAEAIYKKNPLHGIKLEQVLNELVDHYGWDILYAYLNLNCFKTNAGMVSSLKFLRKTAWAQEKVEGFYLYQYKGLPRADDEQFQLPPRDRIVPAHHDIGTPAELSVEDAERLRQKRANNTRARNSSPTNPWGK